jgi:enamine deaminase RidA (YjgF/YER057c/UK114 family)
MKCFAPLAAGLALAAVFAGSASAQIVRGGDPKGAIASVVTVPAGYDTIYVSGMTPPMLDPKGDPALTATFGDTKTQTLGVLKRIEDALKSQGATMADVVMMRVLLVGDPAKGGKMDFAGMMESYKTYSSAPQISPTSPRASLVRCRRWSCQACWSRSRSRRPASPNRPFLIRRFRKGRRACSFPFFVSKR